MFTRMQTLQFWQKAELIWPERVEEVAHQLISFRSLYEAVQAQTAVPWYVIGALDYREEDFSHSGYLGNGDPLDRPTTHVPRGRGPFHDWESGAIDAIHISGWDRLPSGGHWDIVTALLKCEAYNGMGYSHMGLRSPYVWAGTTMQQRGKYTADGHFDPSAWDTQVGCAALFLELKAGGIDVGET